MTTLTTSYSPKRLREVEVFAYIRFANESITFQQTLNSLLPTVTKGILVYHRLPDDATPAVKRSQASSIKIAQDFCAAHPSFELVCYRHVVYGQKHDKYFRDRVCRQRAAQGLAPLAGFNQELPFVNTLQAFYEFARDQILQRAQTPFPYAFKVDGDHVYDAQVIQQQIDFLATAPELVKFLGLPKFNVYYSRMRDQLFFSEVAAEDDHFFFLAHTMEFTSYCEDKYDIHGQLINAKAHAYEIVKPLHYAKEIIVGRSRITRFLHKLLGKPLNKFYLTREYLYSLLPQHGAQFKALYGNPAQTVSITSYRFTPEQCHEVYKPEQAVDLTQAAANGLPSHIQQRYPAACSLPTLPAPDLEPLYQFITTYGKAAPTILAPTASLATIRAANQQGIVLLSSATVPWFNSAHFQLQKHAMLNKECLGDYTDAQLEKLGLVPFHLFRTSALFQELAIRYPYFHPDSFLFNEEQLLQVARQFDYSDHFDATGQPLD